MPTFSGSLQYPKDTPVEAAIKQVPMTILEDGITKVATEFWVDASEGAIAQTDKAEIGYGDGQQVSVRISDGVTTETITAPGNLGDAWSVAQALTTEISNIELVDGYPKSRSKVTIATYAEGDYSITISGQGETDITVSHTASSTDPVDEIAAQLEASLNEINPSWFEVSRNGAELTLVSPLQLTVSTTGTTTPANTETNIETENAVYLHIVANNPGDTITYDLLAPASPANFAVTNITAASGASNWKKIAQIKSWFAIVPGQRAVTSYVQRTFYKADGSEKAGRENSEVHPDNLEDLLT